MTANELSKRFLLWFQKEYPEARIYRNNAGCFKTQAGNWVRYGIPNKGGTDYIAFVPVEAIIMNKNNPKCHETTFLTVQFYEIKTAKDRMSKDQINFANQITKTGGDYYIVKETTGSLKNGYGFTKEDSIKRDIKVFIDLGFYLEKWRGE